MSFLEERLKQQHKQPNSKDASSGASFLDSRLQSMNQRNRELAEQGRQSMPSVLQMNQNLQRTINPTGATSTPSNKELRKSWVDERIEREKTTGPKWSQNVSKALEPISRVVYGAASHVSPLIKGIGAGLGLGTNDVDGPQYNPTVGTNVAEFAGQAIGPLVNPGGISAAGFFRAGQGAAQMATKAGVSSRVAQRAIEGGTAGALEGVYATGLEGGDGKDLLINTALGAGLGAAGDVAIPFISDGVKALVSKYRQKTPMPVAETLALQGPRTRGNANTAATPDVISPEYTFSLPEASPQTTARIQNVAEGTKDLAAINDELRQLQASYERAIIDEFNYLKDSFANRGGVKQGSMTFDADGNVTARTGRESSNPQWYRDFHAEHGKLPSQKELYNLAKQRIDNGFSDGTVDVPSWKERTEYDANITALTDVRDTIQKSIRELDPALNVVDTPLKSTELSFTPKPRTQPKPIVPEVSPQTYETPIVNLPEANQQAGFSAFGKSGKFTNPEDTRTYIRSRTEREAIDGASVVEKTYSKMFDDIQRMNMMDKELEKVLGRKLEPQERSYYKALNSRGADMISNHILTERLVDINGNVVGQSLKSIVSQIPSGKEVYTNFTDYLIAKHAITRMGRGERVYNKKVKMTVEKAQDKVAQYDQTYPQFATIANNLYEWNRQMAKTWLVDTGIIKPETLDTWLEQNPNWIPNKRFFSQMERRNKGNFSKSTYADQKNPVQSYNKGGSERDIIDPIESLIEYTDKYVKTAKRNEVMQTLYRNLEESGNLEGWATIVKREPVQVDNDLADDLLNSLDNEMDLARWRKGDKDKDNVVSVIVNGERVYMRVEDPELLEALANVDTQGRNAVIEASRKLTNAFKNLTTGINPVFSLTRNIFRDIPEGYVFSQTTDNPFKYAWDVLDGFVSVFADGAYQGIDNTRMLQKVTPESFRRFLLERATLYKDYKAAGGGHSSPVAADRNMLSQSKDSLLPQNNRNIPRKVLAVLENLNSALESGVRLGEFKRTIQKGGSTTGAVFNAQDVTTNFKRKGSVIRDVDAMVPYMNAAMQGLDKYTRAFKDRPVATVAKALGVISAPTIALFAINHDNPDYQKLSNYNKDNFYMLPTNDGKFIKIAKPRELGVTFSALLERTMRAWYDEDPDAFKDFADTARTMFAPPLVGDVIEGKNPLRSTIFGPLVEVDANENFMGAPIVPQNLQGLSPRHQHDATTSEVGKFIGDTFNVSPKQVDHLIRAYTGVIGQLGLPATTQGSSVWNTLTKQMVVDPALSSDAMSNFYEIKDELQQQYNDARATGVIPEGYNDEYRKALNSIADQMGDYTSAMRQVDEMDMSSKEKADIKRQLSDERNDIARRAYEAVRDAIRDSSR